MRFGENDLRCKPRGVCLNPKRVSVDLGARSYDIIIQAGLIDSLAKHGTVLLAANHAVVITDEKVGSIYLDRVVQQLKTTIGRVDSIAVPDGERSKSIRESGKLWNRLLKLNSDRHSIVIALGGGVVGDLAGFVAATFARGIRLVQIPTSLVAQVDSSVGGKVGINLTVAKNMVGVFCQPAGVLIDPQALATLDDANYFSGLAEVVKYGVIMDREFFEFIEANAANLVNRDDQTLTTVIAKCCELKAEVVRDDEREEGRRAILNYGHTFGHAIEAVYGYGQYLHGQAISIGMHCAAKLANRLGLVDEAFVLRQKSLFESLHLPTFVPQGKEIELVKAMHRDKKVARGVLRVVLPTKLGEVEIVDSPGDDHLASAFH